MAVSRSRRFYLVSGKWAYTLAFEAREDAFPRALRWSDLIAGTLRVGEEARE